MIAIRLFILLLTVIPIWPAKPPGTEQWTQKERSVVVPHMGTVVFNVTTPTLTAYLPDKTHAGGAGVVIAPGGACVALVMDSEGKDAAQWFARHGVAAFVLKYRIIEKRGEGMPNVNEDDACKYGIADGIQALKVVRAHAAQWGIMPNRVGFVGFSAGGMLASEALVNPDAAARPDFAGLIYGAPFASMPVIPKGLPPVFMAWAQDDTTGGYAMVRLYKGLMDAGNAPEAHIYASGGHGFGMHVQGTTSDHWIDEFYWWLRNRGFLTPQKIGQTNVW